VAHGHSMNCKYCPAGRPPAKRCPFCHYCLQHQKCVCVACRQCEKKQGPKDICYKCGRCISHHAKGSYIGKDFPHRSCQYTARPKTTYLLNPLQRTIGVEVEVSNLGQWGGPLTKILKYTHEHDGSVQPSQAEFVLSPAGGDRLQKGLLEFLRLLHAADAGVNSTCGYHVHVDAATASYSDLRRCYALFALLQEQIFGSLIHISRYTNAYCAPVKQSFRDIAKLFKLTNPLMKEWFHGQLYGIQASPEMDLGSRRMVHQMLAQKKAHKYENAARRHALNFHAWMMRGTIEFRCKEGTLDQGDFLLWPLWCGWFVDSAMRQGGKYSTGYTDAEIVDMLTQNKPPTLEAFTKRFMPEVVQAWVRTRLVTPPAAPVAYDQGGIGAGAAQTLGGDPATTPRVTRTQGMGAVFNQRDLEERFRWAQQPIIRDFINEPF